MRITDVGDTHAQMVEQLGVIARRQLREHGWRADQIDSAVQVGILEPVHRGVYRLPAGGRPAGQPAMAAVLRAGPGARISGAGVLAHHRLAALDPATVGSVLLPPPRRLRPAPFPWSRDLAPDHDHAALGPIAGTTVDRALVEVAGIWPRRRWLSAVDHARWQRLATTTGIRAAAERLGGRHRGSQQVRRLVAAGELDQESHGERDLRDALDALALALEVRWQVWISEAIRVDALLPEVRLVLEYDGRDHHDHPRDVAADAQRDRELAALGYHVLRLRAEDLRDLDQLRRRIDAAIASARRSRPVTR